MSIFVRAYAFLTRKPLVWLKDDEHVGGDVTLTFARKSAFDGLTAPRYPFFNVREVILNPGGTVSGCSYVKYWKYAKDVQS